MKNKNFLHNYFNDLSNLVKPNNDTIRKLEFLKDLIIKIKKNNRKVIIFGNGGSASIASHFSLDLTKNANIRCVNLNEAGLITCFANDYGFSNWVSKSIKFYSDKGDLLILISSSGKSKNMINAARIAKKYQISKVVTLTGFSKNNLLKKNGDLNFWIESKSYNYIENIHQIWLLSVVDFIIGKREYIQKR